VGALGSVGDHFLAVRNLASLRSGGGLDVLRSDRSKESPGFFVAPIMN
jgi:hypothetical protein